MSTVLPTARFSIANAANRPQPRLFWPLMCVVLVAHGLALWALQAGLVFNSLPTKPTAVDVQLLPPRPLADSMQHAAPLPPNVPALPSRPLAPRTFTHPHQPRPRSAPPLQSPAFTAAATAATTPLPLPEAVPQPQAKHEATVEPNATVPMSAAPSVTASAAQQTTRETGSSARTEAAPLTQSTSPPAFGAAYLNNPKPDYPSLARRLGEEGTVVLRVKVTAQGHVETLHVQQSSGYGPLDAAALNAVRQWTFTPARLAGKPQAGWVLVPIQFSLAR